MENYIDKLVRARDCYYNICDNPYHSDRSILSATDIHIIADVLEYFSEKDSSFIEVLSETVYNWFRDFGFVGKKQGVGYIIAKGCPLYFEDLDNLSFDSIATLIDRDTYIRGDYRYSFTTHQYGFEVDIIQDRVTRDYHYTLI